MLVDAVKRCLVRDLAGFNAELDGYRDDATVWALPPGVRNSTGTLVVHGCGNLRHFIGGVLGKSGYVRDRDAEFAVRDLSRSELEKLLAVTRDEVVGALDGLTPEQVAAEYPMPVGGVTIPTGRFLVHLAVHLTYHLGQADVHRRVVTGEAVGVGSVGLKQLADPILP
jgi:uncharacterized damage-inducible protein DinB